MRKAECDLTPVPPARHYLRSGFSEQGFFTVSTMVSRGRCLASSSGMKRPLVESRPRLRCIEQSLFILPPPIGRCLDILDS